MYEARWVAGLIMILVPLVIIYLIYIFFKWLIKGND